MTYSDYYAKRFKALLKFFLTRLCFAFCDTENILAANELNEDLKKFRSCVDKWEISIYLDSSNKT